MYKPITFSLDCTYIYNMNILKEQSMLGMGRCLLNHLIRGSGATSPRPVAIFVEIVGSWFVLKLKPLCGYLEKPLPLLRSTFSFNWMKTFKGITSMLLEFLISPFTCYKTVICIKTFF